MVYVINILEYTVDTLNNKRDFIWAAPVNKANNN
jgi:hypothetical protein